MTPKFLTRKATAAGNLFRLDGKGPWRSEYNTDTILDRGTYPVREADGTPAGEWLQETFGHWFPASAKVGTAEESYGPVGRSVRS